MTKTINFMVIVGKVLGVWAPHQCQVVLEGKIVRNGKRVRNTNKRLFFYVSFSLFQEKTSKPFLTHNFPLFIQTLC